MEKAKKNARTVSENRAGKSVLWDIPYVLRVNFYLRGFLMAACAAASRAIGTRKGEQET